MTQKDYLSQVPGLLEDEFISSDDSDDSEINSDKGDSDSDFESDDCEKEDDSWFSHLYAMELAAIRMIARMILKERQK